MITNSGCDVEIRVRRLPAAGDLPLPERATADAAGFDLRAAVNEPLKLEPGARALVPTGLAVELPRGYEAQLRPRSGLALRQGLTLLNSPGTVDSDYRGEVGVVMINLGNESVTIERGDRVAQLVVQRVPAVSLREVSELAPSRRGAGGFGHTGDR